jgi:hypothetical protein
MNQKLKLFDNKKKLVHIQNRLDGPKTLFTLLPSGTSTPRKKGSFLNLKPNSEVDNSTPRKKGSFLNLRSNGSPGDENMTPRRHMKVSSMQINFPLFLGDMTPRSGKRRGSLLNVSPEKKKEEVSIQLEEPKFNIIEPHRTFVFEGKLQLFTKEEELLNELSEIQKMKATRVSLLFSDMILFCHEGEAPQSLIYSSHYMLNPPESIPWCRDINHEMFQLVCHDKTLTLIAASANEKKKWMFLIDDTIDAIVTKGTFDYELKGKSEPLYTPLISYSYLSQYEEELQEKRKTLRNSTSTNQGNSVRVDENLVKSKGEEAVQNVKKGNLVKIIKENHERKCNIENLSKEQNIEISVQSSDFVIEKTVVGDSTMNKVEYNDDIESKEPTTNVAISEPTTNVVVVNDTEESTMNAVKESMNETMESSNIETSKETQNNEKENELVKENLKKETLKLELSKVSQQMEEKKTGRLGNLSLTARIAGAFTGRNVHQEEKQEEESKCVIS